MRFFLLTLLVLAFASVAAAQLDSYTLTVTASRSISVPPDQATIGVYVEASQSAGIGDVLAVVHGLGLSQTNLSTVYSVFDGPGVKVPNLVWSFNLKTPLSSLKDTLSALIALRAPGAIPGFTVTFLLSGIQVSPQLAAAQSCPLTALVADARAQAQALAQASGYGVGDISTISDGTGQTLIGSGQAALGPVLVAASALFTPTPLSPLTCTIVVKFKLTLS